MSKPFMLVFSRHDGGMCATWHETEAVALRYIMDLPHKQWMIIVVGSKPNNHPVILEHGEV